ncbi:MAG: MazG-like family protein [Alphaproteobacteria bacterium]|nr:MazG-like family protein [Alphaproteobacteria bacterium]
MNTFELISQWAHDRNLIEGATRQAQMLKLTEEVGELAAGIAKAKEQVVKDSIGDCVVVLTILAKQSGLTIEECINAAYEEIKDRKGRMIDGIFVREE